jgi:lipoprotein-releasing system ATP-binding protein
VEDVVVELEGVVKDYGDEIVTRVLHGIELRIRRGELVALVGPSGSGKSTLLNLLGLLDRPSAGKLVLLGRDTARLEESELTELRGRSIGFVFQFHHLIPALTAAENVAMPLFVAEGRVRGEHIDRARALLGRLGLAKLASAHPRRMSGGEQQRVAIARALIQRPALVLADEPTGNLDTKTADEVFEMLRSLNRETGTALLVVTHDPRLAARCDRVIELVDGRIVRDVHNGADGAALPG